MKLSEKLINLGITCNYPECVEAADALDAAEARIKRLEEALRPHACGCKPERRGGECINHGPMESCSNYRARAALKGGDTTRDGAPE